MTGSALIDFWAPGASIRTPVETAEQYGTSFSSPHVAGVWTRLHGRYPSQSNAWIKSQLATCPQRTDPRTGLSRPRICWKSIWQ